MIKKIAVFDFDGTITKHDTLFGFIAFTKGYIKFACGIFIHLPLLFLYKFGLISNEIAKEKIFSYFFKGMSYDTFKKFGVEYIHKIEKDIRISALEKIQAFQNDKIPVYIVSASIKDWIEPWAASRGFEKVIATEIEISNQNIITGKFKGRNCYGIEKVNRLRNEIINRDNLYIIAYGDSKGDNELLNFSDESYLNAF